MFTTREYAAMLRSLLCVSLLFTLAPPATAEAPQQDAFFPLMAWDGPPNDPKVFQTMRECGLTIAGFVPPAGLDNCHAAGLKAIVSDARTSGYDWTNVDADAARKQVTELVEQVKDHPTLYGYYLRDEPTTAFFSGLAKVSDVVQELHPGAWPYINLFPNYADMGQLGAPSYDAYLERFIEVCRPPILSYDHYALLEGGGMRDNYFANLEAVRRAGLKHNLPTWNIVSTVACLTYREATPADLRFQVYTSLAYGMRGIGYFKYFAVPIGNFRAAPIDHFGHKTPTWDILQNVNLQVAQLAPTLLALKSDRVYHFGETPEGCTGPDDKSLVSEVGENMLVGDFTHKDGARYVMIVNKDFVHSAVCAPKFRQSPKKLELVSPYSGALVPYEGEQVWLAPGQGHLLRITP
jgi:hypothetical protein